MVTTAILSACAAGPRAEPDLAARVAAGWRQFGLDGVVFTGGIGENADAVRQAILARLGWLPPFEVRVIAANEERAMAEDVAPLL